MTKNMASGTPFVVVLAQGAKASKSTVATAATNFVTINKPYLMKYKKNHHKIITDQWPVL
jgi:hypothetical protein